MESNKLAPALNNINLNTTTEIEDPKTGEIITSTPDIKMKAVQAFTGIKKSMLQTYLLAAEVLEHKLYLHAGFKTAKEFFEAAHISSSQGYRFAKIGSDIRRNGMKETGELLPYTDQFLALGMKKLDKVITHSQEETEEMYLTGKLKIGGQEYTIDEISDKSIRDIDQEMKKITDKAERAAFLEEKVKGLELEKSQLEKELGEKTTWFEENRERIEDEEVMKKNLDDAWTYAERVRKLVMGFDLDKDWDIERGSPVEGEIVDSYYRLTQFMEETAVFLRTINIHAMEWHIHMRDESYKSTNEEIEEILARNDNQNQN